LQLPRCGGISGVDDFQSVSLYGFRNLDYITFSAYSANNASEEEVSFMLDNIAASVVPIPAAVWLFGSGLGLLGWMRKNYFLG
jgi:hypothetical protein